MVKYEIKNKKWFDSVTPVNAVQASGTVGTSTNGVVTIELTLVGTEGNDYSVIVADGVGNNVALSAVLSGYVLTITLGTDGAGALDASKNTAILVAAAIDALDEFDGSKSGTGADVVVKPTSATGTLTFTGVTSDTETVTIGTDVYEFDTGGAVTPGNILVDISGGNSAAQSVTALAAAILSDGDGTYTGVDGAGDTIAVAFIATGVAGNAVVTTETCTNASFGAVTLEGGIDGATDLSGGLYATPANTSVLIKISGVLYTTESYVTRTDTAGWYSSTPSAI